MATAVIPSIITTVDGRQHERITKISNKRAALLLSYRSLSISRHQSQSILSAQHTFSFFCFLLLLLLLLFGRENEFPLNVYGISIPA
jgi:hypothetical protein